jgi:cell wall-associated NlpC family hydrolase
MDLRDTFVSIIKQQAGKPYIYGTQGPDTHDCSGLVNYAFEQIDLPFPARLNANEISQYFLANKVERLQAPPGSLFFYNSPIDHVMVVTEHWDNGTIILTGARGGDATTTTIQAATIAGAYVATEWTNYWLSKFQFAVDPFQGVQG